MPVPLKGVAGVCAVIAGAWLFAGGALAEVLILRDGKKLAGDCRVAGKEVSVARGMTTFYVQRASIERVELQPAEQQQLDQLRASRERAGASGLCDIGKWLDDHLQFEEADKYYERAIEADPNHAAARAALGFRREGRDWIGDPAKQLARAVMGFGNTAADACVRIGKAYAGKNQRKSAELAFRRALVANPEHPEALQLIQPFIADYKCRNAYRAPLEGRTIAVAGQDHKMFAYMYNAIDFAKVDDQGRICAGDEGKLESYCTFDAPVYASAAGEVIAADGHWPDIPIGRMGDFLQANSVCIQHSGGEFTLYAHLKQGSVVVRKGQRVKAGELLGKVGNSGSSSAPHLHFCLYDIDGISLPVKFTEPDTKPAK